MIENTLCNSQRTVFLSLIYYSSMHCVLPNKKTTPEKGIIIAANVNIIAAGVKYRVSALYLALFFRDPSFKMSIVPHRATIAASSIRE